METAPTRQRTEGWELKPHTPANEDQLRGAASSTQEPFIGREGEKEGLPLETRAFTFSVKDTMRGFDLSKETRRLGPEALY
ncbi:UNVERIFIED_CONTAM: hypothetical protein K2H54_023942 [Gekko kuhli]